MARGDITGRFRAAPLALPDPGCPGHATGTVATPARMMAAALRQVMLMGKDPSDASRSRLIDDAALLNNRPRRTPGRRNPAEAMAVEIAALRSNAATENGI